MRQAGQTAWAYCGCPEGRGFDETGDKGVLVGEVSPGEAKLEFVPLCKRRYREITVDVTGKAPAAALREALPADIREDTLQNIRQMQSKIENEVPGNVGQFDILGMAQILEAVNFGAVSYTHLL